MPVKLPRFFPCGTRSRAPPFPSHNVLYGIAFACRKCYANFMDNPLLVPETNDLIPLQVAAAGQTAARRFIEFFTANIRNRNTRGLLAATSISPNMVHSISVASVLATGQPVKMAISTAGASAEPPSKSGRFSHQGELPHSPTLPRRGRWPRTRRERPSLPSRTLPDAIGSRCGQRARASSPCSAPPARGSGLPAAPPLTSAAPGGLPEGRSAPRNIGLCRSLQETLHKRVLGFLIFLELVAPLRFLIFHLLTQSLHDLHAALPASSITPAPLFCLFEFIG